MGEQTKEGLAWRLTELLRYGVTPQWTYREEVAREVEERADEIGLDVEVTEDGERWKVAVR